MYSRHNPSPRVEKSRETRPAQIRYQLRVGPRITHTGDVFIPYVKPHPELEQALRASGWHWDKFARGWRRGRFDLVDKRTGNEYTLTQWLDWAHRRYAAAWPWFENKEETR